MPCDMSKYPADWKQRRERILARAGNCCEECGVQNHLVGYRDGDGRFWKYFPTDFREGEEEEFVKWTPARLKEERLIKIVLTIAHTIPDGPLDCPDDHLKALCQKCHNALDAPMRARHRKEKAHASRAVASLF